MKLTKSHIKQLIKEELRNVLREQDPSRQYVESLEDRIKKLEICLQKQCPPVAPASAEPPPTLGVLNIQSFKEKRL